jgi:hypothetical protein
MEIERDTVRTVEVEMLRRGDGTAPQQAKSKNAARILERGLGGLGVGLAFAEARDPEAAMNIVDVDQPLVWEGAPRKRKVGAIALGIAGPKMGDFPALIVELAA